MDKFIKKDPKDIHKDMKNIYDPKNAAELAYSSKRKDSSR